MNSDLELKLQAWLDGELSPREARDIGQQWAGDAEASLLIGELRSIREALSGQEMVRTVPETRDFYWSKIARQIEREAQASRVVPARASLNWRRWLAPVAGFGSLACILLLAIKPMTPPTFDEISSTGSGMEAVTFHDQAAGMTVVWLQDPAQVEQPAAPAAAVQTPIPTPDSEQGTVEME